MKTSRLGGTGVIRVRPVKDLRRVLDIDEEIPCSTSIRKNYRRLADPFPETDECIWNHSNHSNFKHN